MSEQEKKPDPSQLILAKIGQDPTTWTLVSALAAKVRPDSPELEKIKLALFLAGYPTPVVADLENLHGYLVRSGWRTIPSKQDPKAGDIAVYHGDRLHTLHIVCRIHLSKGIWWISGSGEEQSNRPDWWLRPTCATCSKK